LELLFPPTSGLPLSRFGDVSISALASSRLLEAPGNPRCPES
jgi:hypothetical protein